MRGVYMRRSAFWFNFFMVIVGIVVGTLVATLTNNLPYLSWLGFSVAFGTTSPLALNLSIINFTFSCNVSISIAVIIFIIIALVVGNLCRKK